MKLIYGTHNPAKVDAMQKRLKTLGIEIISLEELDVSLPDVEEGGSSPLENARLKAKAYYQALHRPVFSCDSGLYFDGVPQEDQPGVHVRTVHGKCLTDEEMVEHYTRLAAKYGGLRARYRNAICLVLDEGHVYEAMEESMESEPFLLVSAARPIRRKGFPLDSFSVDLETGKYYYDLEDADATLDQVAVEDGFLEFFRRYLPDLSAYQICER